MIKELDTRYQTLEKRCDSLEKIIKELSPSLLKKLEEYLGSEYEVHLEGPNIIFKDGTIQYSFEIWKFKKDTSHKEYIDLIASFIHIMEFHSIGVLLPFPLKKLVKLKLQESLEMIKEISFKK